MLRRLGLCLLSVTSVLSIPALAAAEDAPNTATAEATPADKATDDDEESPRSSAPASAPIAAPTVAAVPEGASQDARPPVAPEPAAPDSGWHFEAHGYFRAPMALSLSTRPNPDTPDGPAKGQISYAPNRTVDSTYYSFAYTRLQEQDWAEITFHLKRKHVDAALGWMGYWFSAAGFRNPDAAGVPGVGSLTLDTDFEVGNIKPNIALQMGAWWPGFGYFEKYDTYTLGRFRHIGEQLKLTVPINPDLKLEVVEGFGTGRDGKFDYGVAANSPLYANRVAAILLAYANVRLAYKKVADVGLHYNNEWMRDPYLNPDALPSGGKAYTQSADSHMSVVGAEANLRLPYAGRLWISPSYISVKNGWALGNVGGTEVMHAQGGFGIATNYLGWTNTPASSTGSGSMFNLGFLYENTLSNVLGKAPGSAPDVKLNIFGLMTNASLDLPPQAVFNPSFVNRTSIKQMKFGADVTVQALDWLGLMLRGDSVNYDTQNPGYIFSAITARLTVSSHFLSSESIYLQYSRYTYGDKMTLAGQWPWGTPLVEGSAVVQGGPYVNKKPDMDVIKLQATAAF